jgi:GNAT superfamily N-acetyltransferase
MKYVPTILQAVVNNLKELGLKSVYEFNENIETEMRCLHYLQTRGKLQNPFFLYFSRDNFTIQISSTEHILLAMNPPEKNDDYFYIRMLYVVPKKRGQNLGTDYVNAVKKLAKKVDYKSIQVEPELDSLDFWKKQGFEFMPNESNQRMIYYV